MLRRFTREKKFVQREGYVSSFTVEKVKEELDSLQETLNELHKK